MKDLLPVKKIDVDVSNLQMHIAIAQDAIRSKGIWGNFCTSSPEYLNSILQEVLYKDPSEIPVLELLWLDSVKQLQSYDNSDRIVLEGSPGGMLSQEILEQRLRSLLVTIDEGWQLTIAVHHAIETRAAEYGLVPGTWKVDYIPPVLTPEMPGFSNMDDFPLLRTSYNFPIDQEQFMQDMMVIDMNAFHKIWRAFDGIPKGTICDTALL